MGGMDHCSSKRPQPASRLVLVLGGARSGKSRYAQQLAESLPGPHVFLATCPRSDDPEMLARIARHQADRAGRGWQTLEEPLDLAAAFHSVAPGSVVLVDCLTLWTSNLMFDAEQRGASFAEDDMAAVCAATLSAARAAAGAIIFVSNEVGLGIVPDNALARAFRDLAGRCNQAVASAADDVVFMVSGLPLTLKSQGQLAR